VRLSGNRWLLGTGLGLLLFISPCVAQGPVPRDEVLRLVPPDTGVCLIVSNLRERAEKLHGTSWLKALLASPLGQMFAHSPEAAQLAKREEDLKKHLQIDWAELRDEILGDLVVLAYRPGSAEHHDEDGLLLLWARRPDVLAKFIDRLNQAQTSAHQLKELKSVTYRGQEYFRRSEADKTHYYYVRGSLLAFSVKEALIRRTIEQHQAKPERTHPLVEQVQRAHAENAVATVWLNPRAFDADLQQKVKQSLGQDAQVLKSFLAYWQALDAVVVSANVADSVEAKLSLQARQQNLPKAIQRLFRSSVPSDLWTRFPAGSMLRIASRLDTEALAETLAELSPSPFSISEINQRLVGPALGVDLAKDVLPNVGPDWGMCVFAGADGHDLPLVLAALAVRPGKLEIDKSLYKGAQFLAGLAVWHHNSSHADSIRLQTAVLDNVEVKYLAGDKTFPPGFQPAFALKDGYFLLASSPEAVRNFKNTAAPVNRAGDNPIAQLSLSQVSKFIKDRREKAIAALAEKNQIQAAVARQWLDAILAGLDLFDHVLLSERREAGQVTWSLRLVP
jgi:hypothetical protein